MYIAAHRVPDHFRLLAHRNVRLIVFVGLRPVGGRIVAARQRLFGEVVRLAATLVDEIGREIEPPAVAGQTVKLDQRELDLLMAGIAAPLPGSLPKVAAIWSMARSMMSRKRRRPVARK